MRYRHQRSVRRIVRPKMSVAFEQLQPEISRVELDVIRSRFRLRFESEAGKLGDSRVARVVFGEEADDVTVVPSEVARNIERENVR